MQPAKIPTILSYFNNKINRIITKEMARIDIFKVLKSENNHSRVRSSCWTFSQENFGYEYLKVLNVMKPKKYFNRKTTMNDMRKTCYEYINA